MSLAEREAAYPEGAGPVDGTVEVGAPVLRRVAARAVTLVPGVGVATALALAATVAGRAFPVIGAPVIAIVAGIVISALWRPSQSLRPGLGFTSRTVLQGSIIVLGFGLSFHQVVAANESSMPVLAGTLLAALGMAWLVGRLLKLRTDVTTLVGVGTAICGASAIAATDAVIDADPADVSYAVATIFSFNVVAVLTFPAIGHAFGFSQHAFGLWAGTAINDTSSVVAASTVYGAAATSYGVIVKLTRTLAIVPITLAIALWRNRSAKTAGGDPGRAGGHFSLRRAFPLFILGFVAAVVLESVGAVPPSWHGGLAQAATFMITAALAAIGLSTDLGHLRRTGGRPLVLGAALWLTVGLTSVALQAATGTL